MNGDPCPVTYACGMSARGWRTSGLPLFSKMVCFANSSAPCFQGCKQWKRERRSLPCDLRLRHVGQGLENLRPFRYFRKWYVSQIALPFVSKVANSGNMNGDPCPATYACGMSARSWRTSGLPLFSKRICFANSPAPCFQGCKQWKHERRLGPTAFPPGTGGSQAWA